MNVVAISNFLLRGEHVSAGEMITVSAEQAADLWGRCIYPKEFPANKPERDLRPLPPPPPSSCPWEPSNSNRWPHHYMGATSCWTPPFKHTLPKGGALRAVLDKIDQIHDRRKAYRQQQLINAEAREREIALWMHIEPLPLEDEEKARRPYSPPPFIVRHRPKIIYGDWYEPVRVY